MKLAKILKHCRIDKPDRLRLADHDAAETFGLAIDKDDVKAMLADGIRRLAELQERLYAQDRWAVLIVLQGMDAAGKDSVIKHVMSGVNPQGCEIHAFKAPSEQELQHDFLWRAAVRLPRRGQIGIFNRSYYEEVLVVRVHPRVLAAEKLAPQLAGKDIWKHRFKEIRAFEHHLVRNGTLVLKFHLRISKEEQRQRFLARLDEPAKRWKFSMNDVIERKLWDKYMDAYEEHDPRNFDGLCALVRDPGRPQACGVADGRRGDHRGAGRPQARVPEGPGQGARRTEEGGARAQGGEAALTSPLASVHRLPLKAYRSQSRLTRRLLFAATLGRRGQMMAMRHQISAMNRKALQASSGAALILGGLLLLSAP